MRSTFVVLPILQDSEYRSTIRACKDEMNSKFGMDFGKFTEISIKLLAQEAFITMIARSVEDCWLN